MYPHAIPFSPLRPVLVRENISQRDIEVLCEATMDRDILLGDISEYVMKHQLRLSQKSIDVANTVAQRLSFSLKTESEAYPWQKYFPDKCLAELSKNSKTKSISNARPTSWSWSEYLASGAPISGHHVSAAMNCIFLEEPTLICTSRSQAYPLQL